MTRAILALVHNVELDAILRLPLHVLEQALVDEHFQRAEHARRQHQDEVALCGSKAATAANMLSGAVCLKRSMQNSKKTCMYSDTAAGTPKFNTNHAFSAGPCDVQMTTLGPSEDKTAALHQR